jgi:hypothetical protein
MQPLTKAFLISLVSLTTAGAQVTNIPYVGSVDGVWSDPAKWTASNVPNTNGKQAQFSGATNVTIDVDQNFTINSFIDGFSAGGATLGGSGLLTIDRNQTATAVGIENATGNAGGTLRITGNVAISNSASTGTNGITTIRNANSAANTVLFDANSTLTVNTPLQTVAGAGGQIQLNGTLATSGSNIQINSTNVTLGAGHSSVNFERDFVMFANSKLTVNDAAAGSVLSATQKFQVNGNNATLELNGANSINSANFVVGGANSFLLDINANQLTLGSITIGTGILTIDIANGVTSVQFANSSANFWDTGTIQIPEFREGLVRFGTDATGLTASQLFAINGGGLSLDQAGFLTAVAPIPEPSTYALMALGLGMCILTLRRRQRSSVSGGASDRELLRKAE